MREVSARRKSRQPEQFVGFGEEESRRERKWRTEQTLTEAKREWKQERSTWKTGLQVRTPTLFTKL